MQVVQTAAPVQQYRYTSDPSSLTTVFKSLLWAGVVMGFIALFSDFAQLSMVFSGSFTDAQAEANNLRQGSIALLYVALFLATSVVFMFWVYRANTNCRGFGARGMKFTPGWAVAWFFVPFANLYKPYQCMKEIWDVSSDPVHWSHLKGGALVGWWWMLWLVGNGVSRIASAWASRANSIRALQDATALSIVADVLDLALYLVLIAVIARISRKQEILVRGTAPRFE